MVSRHRADVSDRGSVMDTAEQLDTLMHDLATMPVSARLVSVRANLSKATGDPAGSRRVGRQQTIARMDDHERPEARQALQSVSDGKPVRLTKDPVRLRSKILETGTWHAPHEYPDATVPPPPRIPTAPVAAGLYKVPTACLSFLRQQGKLDAT